MAWVNPLDKLPQVPVDWANHIIWGGGLGIALLALLGDFLALLGVLVVSFAKKIVDYHLEHESLEMCVGKGFVTAVWPFTIWVALGAQQTLPVWVSALLG
jgi:hypothetical protein